MKGLRRRYEQFRGAGAELYTVSTDTEEALAEYRRRNDVPFEMLSDKGKKVIKQYDVYNPSERDGVAVPAVFIIDRSGVVRYSNIQGKLIRIRNKRLLKELENIGAG